MSLRSTRLGRLIIRPISTGQSVQAAAPVEGELFKWSKFNWEDPFNLESRLTEDEKAFRDAFKVMTHMYD